MGHTFPMWSYFWALVGPPNINTHYLPVTSRAPMSGPDICDFWRCSYGFMSLELKKLKAQMHVNSNLEMPPRPRCPWSFPKMLVPLVCIQYSDVGSSYI